MAKRLVLQEVSSRKDYEIELPCVVGRGEQADLSFPDTTISHRHALIQELDDRIWIEDLKSANGVYVGDQRIREKTLLKPGDSVRIGKTTFLIRRAEDDVWQETLVLHAVEPKAEWRLDHEKLRLIYEITTELSENQDLTALGENIFSRLKEIFHQDRGYLALFQEDGSLKPVFLDFALQTAPISRSIVNRLLQSGESFLLEDALSDVSLKEQESVMALRIRSALCVPLIHHSEIYGLIYLDRNVAGAYKQEDLEFLRTIAFILAPLIENARLWSELKHHYASAMETLKETQARLIDMERMAAYARLAQAMAHEIRNPLMAMGGLTRRMARSAAESPGGEKLEAIVKSVERIEMVLREMDDFVKIPALQKKLTRIDQLIQEEMENHSCEWHERGVHAFLRVNTPHVMVPLDADLFKKALSMIFRESIPGLPRGSDFPVSIQDHGNEIEILIGDVDRSRPLSEPCDPEMQCKPWSLGLFLNIAHKIVSDHGGKLFLDPQASAAFPVMVRIPKTVRP